MPDETPTFVPTVEYFHELYKRLWKMTPIKLTDKVNIDTEGKGSGALFLIEPNGKSDPLWMVYCSPCYEALDNGSIAGDPHIISFEIDMQCSTGPYRNKRVSCLTLSVTGLVTSL